MSVFFSNISNPSLIIFKWLKKKLKKTKTKHMFVEKIPKIIKIMHCIDDEKLFLKRVRRKTTTRLYENLRI